jgi:hypothetical protein
LNTSFTGEKLTSKKLLYKKPSLKNHGNLKNMTKGVPGSGLESEEERKSG